MSRLFERDYVVAQDSGLGNTGCDPILSRWQSRTHIRMLQSEFPHRDQATGFIFAPPHRRHSQKRGDHGKQGNWTAGESCSNQQLRKPGSGSRVSYKQWRCCCCGSSLPCKKFLATSHTSCSRQAFSCLKYFSSTFHSSHSQPLKLNPITASFELQSTHQFSKLNPHNGIHSKVRSIILQWLRQWMRRAAIPEASFYSFSMQTTDNYTAIFARSFLPSSSPLLVSSSR